MLNVTTLLPIPAAVVILLLITPDQAYSEVRFHPVNQTRIEWTGTQNPATLPYPPPYPPPYPALSQTGSPVRPQKGQNTLRPPAKLRIRTLIFLPGFRWGGKTSPKKIAEISTGQKCRKTAFFGRICSEGVVVAVALSENPLLINTRARTWVPQANTTPCSHAVPTRVRVQGRGCRGKGENRIPVADQGVQNVE